MKPSAHTHYHFTGTSQPLFYRISPLYLIILNVITLGLVTLWWNYKHWCCIQRNIDSTISPFFRSLFAPIYAFSLYGMVAETGVSLAIKGTKYLSLWAILKMVSCLPLISNGHPMFGEYSGTLDLIFFGFFVLAIDTVIIQIKMNNIDDVLKPQQYGECR